jgi:glutaminase
MPDLAEILPELAAEMAAIEDRGKVATYIPELARSVLKSSASPSF